MAMEVITITIATTITITIIGLCVCKHGEGPQWPKCCEEDCGQAGECQDGRYKLCMRDCLLVCAFEWFSLGRCACHQGQGEWPNCCEEECGARGECRDGKCVCRRNKGTWPRCRRPGRCRCEPRCGRGARCRKVRGNPGTCACKCRRRDQELIGGR